MNMQTEPARIIGLVGAAVQTILVLLVAFGIDVTKDQQLAIIGAIAAIGTLITALLIRGKVYAPASVETAVPGTDTVD